jgi:hypothetical protein
LIGSHSPIQSSVFSNWHWFIVALDCIILTVPVLFLNRLFSNKAVEKPEIEIGKASLLIKLLLMIVNVLLWVRPISSPPSKWLLKIQFSIKTVPPIKTTILRLALFSNMQFAIVIFPVPLIALPSSG